MQRFLGVFLIVAAGVAYAHEGVRNAAVLDRMESMKAMGAASKTLVGMARGETDFDAGAARAALARLVEEGERTPALFAAPEVDPKSEAKPVIWESFADFTAKSDALVRAAAEADATSLGSLRRSLASVGEACGACHEVYRE